MLTNLAAETSTPRDAPLPNQGRGVSLGFMFAGRKGVTDLTPTVSVNMPDRRRGHSLRVCLPQTFRSTCMQAPLPLLPKLH